MTLLGVHKRIPTVDIVMNNTNYAYCTKLAEKVIEFLYGATLKRITGATKKGMRKENVVELEEDTPKESGDDEDLETDMDIINLADMDHESDMTCLSHLGEPSGDLPMYEVETPDVVASPTHSTCGPTNVAATTSAPRQISGCPPMTGHRPVSLLPPPT